MNITYHSDSFHITCKPFTNNKKNLSKKLLSIWIHAKITLYSPDFFPSLPSFATEINETKSINMQWKFLFRQFGKGKDKSWKSNDFLLVVTLSERKGNAIAYTVW